MNLFLFSDGSNHWIYVVGIGGSLLLVLASIGVIVMFLKKRKTTSGRIKANETKLGNHYSL